MTSVPSPSPFAAAVASGAVINWDAVSAIFTCIAVLVAIWAVIGESRRSRFALGVDLVLKMDERFEAEPMRLARRSAAACLIAKHQANLPQVLNFFETLGLLLRRKAVDEVFVWNTFAYWILHYYAAAEDYVNEGCKRDPNMWCEFKALYRRMLTVEQDKGGLTEAVVRAGVPEFLTKEAQWGADASHKHDVR